ncbi:MAG: hypothetical protein JEZ09_06840 [Salinivirgaceae bacterium]|nr:hypothetical protein [Salinivirgaceae bacterium]
MNKQKFSPIKYLKEKGKKLPILKCLIADFYEEDKGVTICLIIRKQPSGKFSFANILVDRCCLGVKSSIANCNVTEIELNEILEKMRQHGEMLEVTPEYFHNMVYAALDYAEELGFLPPKDFYMTEYLLDPDYISDKIDNIEMGHNGKPLYIQGPFDNSKKIIQTLNNSVGEGGYDYIMEAYE